MIRPRHEEDLERCAALLRRVHEVDRYPVVWPADPVDWLARRDPLAAWVAEEDDQLIGHLSLHAVDDSRARPQWREALGAGVEALAIVSRFFVSPEVRGQGVGSALISRAEQRAALERLQLALDVAEHNREAIGFYERRGWRRVGNAELELSAEPWRLDVVLFVLS
jgi:GNAT superfamily N-acetyltransferase